MDKTQSRPPECSNAEFGQMLGGSVPCTFETWTLQPAQTDQEKMRKNRNRPDWEDERRYKKLHKS